MSVLLSFVFYSILSITLCICISKAGILVCHLMTEINVKFYLTLASVMSCRAKIINPEWVELHKSRGYESPAHKLFMRATGTVTMRN